MSYSREQGNPFGQSLTDFTSQPALYFFVRKTIALSV
uniref:Uncharacterized protein n=1 Tax=Vitis vinifera TaxID=29760 RepID=F6HPJ6_VITVI